MRVFQYLTFLEKDFGESVVLDITGLHLLQEDFWDSCYQGFILFCHPLPDHPLLSNFVAIVSFVYIFLLIFKDIFVFLCQRNIKITEKSILNKNIGDKKQKTHKKNKK